MDDLPSLSEFSSQCEGVYSLIFTDSQRTCGLNCLQGGSRKRRESSIVKAGWTLAINMDRFHGAGSSGDHENFFNFLEFEKNKQKIAKNLIGDEFTDCERRAVYVRSKEEHKGWFSYASKYTFLFSKKSIFYHDDIIDFKNYPAYSKTFKSEYG